MLSLICWAKKPLLFILFISIVLTQVLSGFRAVEVYGEESVENKEVPKATIEADFEGCFVEDYFTEEVFSDKGNVKFVTVFIPSSKCNGAANSFFQIYKITSNETKNWNKILGYDFTRGISLYLSPSGNKIAISSSSVGLITTFDIYDVKSDTLLLESRNQPETINLTDNFIQQPTRWISNTELEYEFKRKFNDPAEVKTVTINEEENNDKSFCRNNLKLYTNSRYPEMRICYDEGWEVSEGGDVISDDPIFNTFASAVSFSKDGGELGFFLFPFLEGGGFYCENFDNDNPSNNPFFRPSEIHDLEYNNIFRARDDRLNSKDWYYFKNRVIETPERPETLDLFCPGQEPSLSATAVDERLNTNFSKGDYGYVQSVEVKPILTSDTKNELYAEADQIVLNSCFNNEECEKLKEKLKPAEGEDFTEVVGEEFPEEVKITNSFTVTGGNTEDKYGLKNSDVNKGIRTVYFNLSDEDNNKNKEWQFENKLPNSANIWIVSHGWNDSIDSFDLKNNFKDIANQIKKEYPNDIVLTLDWSEGSYNGKDKIAKDIPHPKGVCIASTWIKPTAEAVYNKLNQVWGLQRTDGQRIRVIGHSLGSIMSTEISQQFYQTKYDNGNTGADLLIALDPPSEAVCSIQPEIDAGDSYLDIIRKINDPLPGILPDTENNIDGKYKISPNEKRKDFAGNARFTRAFVGRNSMAGNQNFARSADGSYRMDFSEYQSGFKTDLGDEHSWVIDVYKKIVNDKKIVNSGYDNRNLFSQKYFLDLYDQRSHNQWSKDFDGHRGSLIINDPDDFQRLVVKENNKQKVYLPEK